MNRLPLLVLALFALAVPAPAAARDRCPDLPTTKAFADVGDERDYALLPGGDFSEPVTAWRWDRFGALADGALTLAPRADALTRPFCAGRQHPSFRFRARALGSAPLRVSLISRGGAELVAVLRPQDFRALAATPVLDLADALPLRDGRAVMAQVHLRVPRGGTGGWIVDDVHIDPYRVR